MVKGEEKRSELMTDGKERNTKKDRQNSRSERRRLQAQLRERAKLELEHLRSAREQLHNVQIFPYKNSSSGCNKFRKLPLAGSTDLSKVRSFARGFTKSSACFPSDYGEFSGNSETYLTPKPMTKPQGVAGIESVSPMIPHQEEVSNVIRDLSDREQMCSTAGRPEEGGFESATAAHIVSEQDISAPIIHEPVVPKARVPVPMAGEEEVIRAKIMASSVPKRSLAGIVKQLIAFGIVSPKAMPALRAAAANIAEIEACSSGTGACAARGQVSVQQTSFSGAPTAATVAKTLRENILRSHPMYSTVYSILKPHPTDDSSSSSSSEDDEPRMPVSRTQSVQRRSCLKLRKPLWFIGTTTTCRVDWAPHADEAGYMEYVPPVVSLFPPETVELRTPSSDEPPKQFKLAPEGAAVRAAAAAKAAAEGDPEREAAAEAAVATAAALAREAAQEAAEAAAAEATAIAEEEAKALARLRAAAAAIANTEARTLEAKARAGVLRKEEFDSWQRRLEEN